MNRLKVLWSDVVPRKIVLAIAADYWGASKEQLPDSDSDVIDQIVVDCAGSGCDSVVDAVPRDTLNAIANILPENERPSSSSVKETKRVVSGALEDANFWGLFGDPRITDNVVRQVYKAMLKEDSPATFNRDQMIDRIEYEAYKIGVVKFLNQAYFKEKSVHEWVTECGIKITNVSKKAMAERFYSELLVQVDKIISKAWAAAENAAENGGAEKEGKGTKRAREADGDKETEKAQPSPKKARIKDNKSNAPVKEILGLCKPDRGFTRPLNWRVVLTDDSEAILNSNEMLVRGPTEMVEFFEEKILDYLKATK